MELYTSLVRLKQEMNDGQLPPMTPLPKELHATIDPAFTIGYGALTEDPDKGLRCPIRECGRYAHNLTSHVNGSHKEIGGSRGLKKLLSIPQSAPLMSKSHREHARIVMLANHASGRLVDNLNGAQLRSIPLAERRLRSKAVSHDAVATVGAKNLKNRCIAQLSHRLIDLQNTLGRAPTEAEFIAAYGYNLRAALRSTFGTWNNAKAQCGLNVYAQSSGAKSPKVLEHRREHALSALSAWYERYGALPSAKDASWPRRLPLLPYRRTICRAMNAATWGEAMRRAASILNIYGGRYGLPIENKPKEDAA